MGSVGTSERPLRVAVVGSGPSGFYAVAALLGGPGAVEVDVIDRLPTPFGLVRGGVAPDHQNIKAVIRAYDKTAKLPGFRFVGHVSVGRDVTLDELLAGYDQVVLAVGCESANPLGIPGEHLVGSHSATAFVGWYNGHPDHRDLDIDLSATTAVVVGVGNVAMDVTRVLVRDRDELAKTDIADHALARLRECAVADVIVLGRRGVVQAAFSPAEIKEIAELPGVDLVVRPEDVTLDPASEAWLAEHPDKSIRQNLEFLQGIAGRPQTGTRRVHLRLLTAPTALLGAGRVEEVELGRNRLEPDGRGGVRSVDTGVREKVRAGLVFRAIGYRGVALPGCPFDEKKGTIPNQGGRVLGADGRPIPRLYVVGWAKRGPQGLIGTNRADSKDTVDRMKEDRAALDDTPRSRPAAIEGAAVGWSDWERLDAEEVRRGQERSKLREKLVHVDEMLTFLKG
jgi:ferredoxin--NADP+ reductase